MRAAIAILTLTLAFAYAAVARAQSGTCTPPDGPCDIRDATCVGGFCRLEVPESLIPGLTPIALQQPAPRMVTAAEPDITFTFPAGAKTVNVIITKGRPNYDTAGQLANPDAVVWFWSSAWENLTTGVVSYDSGHLVELSNDSCTLKPIAPLKAGTYFLAALGFDAQGSLTHASEIHPFAVTQESTTTRFCSHTEQCDPVGGDAVCKLPDHICVIRCASDRDCFSNETCVFTASTPDFPWGYCYPPGPGCPCSGDQRCDDALNVCYTPAIANQSPGAGCDFCDGSDAPKPNPCYSASAAALIGCVLVRRRPRRPRR